MVNDDLFWLRDDDRKDPEVLKLLENENAFTKLKTKHLQQTQDRLYQLMVSRMNETDVSVPRQRGPYLHASRTYKGMAYPVHVRVPVPGDAPPPSWAPGSNGEQVLLDVNELSKGTSHCHVLPPVPSPCHCAVAFAVDTSGAEHYDIHIKWVAPSSVSDAPARAAHVNCSDSAVVDTISDTCGKWVWGDNRTCGFYTKMDEHDRSFQVWRHIVGTSQDEDVLFLQEDDPSWNVSVSKSESGRFIFLSTGSITTDEEYVLDLLPSGMPAEGHVGSEQARTAVLSQHSTAAAAKVSDMRCLSKRELHVRYSAEHVVYPDNSEAWLILTNRGAAINSRIALAPLSSTGPQDWRLLTGHRDDVEIEGVHISRHVLVLHGRADALPQVWLLPTDQLPPVSSLSQPVPAGGCGGPEEHLAAASAASESPSKPEVCDAVQAGKSATGGTLRLWRIPTSDAAYYIAPRAPQWEGRTLLYTYTSPTTPTQVLELDLVSAVASTAVQHISCMRDGLPDIAELEAPAQASKLVKERAVPNFDRTKYRAARVTMPAADGTLIPVSLFWRPDALPSVASASAGDDFVPLVLPPSMRQEADSLPHLAPVYLEGYGSYGVANDVYFSANLSALADQGVVVATAHIRGGGECGRAWYEQQGKFLTKASTFTDFIDVARGLTEQQIAAPRKIVAYGASAGGLLIGNAINRAPDLWAGAVGDVPFVDLMTTMCDPSIHLTTEEWLEWGNPNLKASFSGLCEPYPRPEPHFRLQAFYDYMKAYSPMDNIQHVEYPPVLLLAGLHEYVESVAFASPNSTNFDLQSTRPVLGTR